MAAFSAGHRVSQIAKLLEHIWLELTSEPPSEYRGVPSLRAILVGQRTSSAFRNTIASSTKLKQALFFALPEEAVGTSKLDSRERCDNRGMKPMLRTLEVLPHSNMISRLTTYTRFLDISWYTTVCTSDASNVVFTDKGRSYQTKKRAGTQASWRKMYLQQEGYML